LFLYPIMGVGMMEMTVTFSEQPRTVMVLNAKDLPEPQLIRDGHFIGRFFKSADDLEKIRVLTDEPAKDTAALSEPEQTFLKEVSERMPKSRNSAVSFMKPG